MFSDIDKKLIKRTAELGCCVCRKMGYPGTPAEIHILTKREKFNSPATSLKLLPLCPEHHRGQLGLHILKKIKFEKAHGFSLIELIEDTTRLLDQGI